MIRFKVHSLIRLMFLFFLSLHLFACAQTKNIVRKSYAYYIESVRGKHPKGGIDEIAIVNSDSLYLPVNTDTFILPAKMDTFIVIYLETSSQLISWDTAWQNEQPYLITALHIAQTPFHAGFVRGGNQVILTPADGNFLWQLQLFRTGPALLNGKTITKDAIILKGMFKGKYTFLKTGPLIELAPMPPA